MTGTSAEILDGPFRTTRSVDANLLPEAPRDILHRVDIRQLKFEALTKRQELDRLVEFYEEFQAYIERVGKLVAADKSDITGAEAARLRIQQQLNDYEGYFHEWLEGERVLNTAIALLIEGPFDFSRETFPRYVLEATVKFEHVIRKHHRELLELHEQIAFLTNEEEATQTTHVDAPPQSSPPKALSERVKDVDAMGETAVRWGGRIVKFVAWARPLLQSVGLS